MLEQVFRIGAPICRIAKFVMLALIMPVALLIGCDSKDEQYIPDSECEKGPVVRVMIGDKLLYVPRSYRLVLGDEAPKNRQGEICQDRNDPPIVSSRMMIGGMFYDDVGNEVLKRIYGTFIQLVSHNSVPTNWDIYEKIIPDKYYLNKRDFSENNADSFQKIHDFFKVPDTGTTFYVSIPEDKQTPYGYPLTFQCRNDLTTRIGADKADAGGHNCHTQYAWSDRSYIIYRFLDSHQPIENWFALDRAVRDILTTFETPPD